MHRIAAFVAVAALAVSACGGGGETAPPSSTTPAPATSAADGGSATTAAPATSEAPRGETAPDFTLVLGDGGTFTLSDERKPVYMVFWAEW